MICKHCEEEVASPHRLLLSHGKAVMATLVMVGVVGPAYALVEAWRWIDGLL